MWAYTLILWFINQIKDTAIDHKHMIYKALYLYLGIYTFLDVTVYQSSISS